MPAQGTFPQTAPTYGTYQWLQLRVGLFLRNELGMPSLDTSANYETWDAYQTGVVDHVIQSGVRDFYFPVLAPGQKRPYAWSFLKAAGTVTQISGTYAYALPADFGGWVGDFTAAAAGATRRIKVIYEGDLRASQSMEEVSGDPEYVTVRAIAHTTLTADQTFELVFFPKPNSTSVLHYRYTTVPGLLTTTNKFPAGVVGHAETIAAACMAKAECVIKGAPGPMTQMYQQQLQASVMLDSGFAGNSKDDELFVIPQRSE
jgi:hypothetical protein